MFFIISYDIVSDRKRSGVAKVLLDYGNRVQKSVFECVITDKQLIELREKVEKLMDFDTDSVRYYRICQKCLDAVEVVGWGTVTEDPRTATLIV
jgi:CRISPR-associated protein Cas2